MPENSRAKSKPPARKRKRKPTTGESMLALVAKFHAKVPPEAWNGLPRDWSINHDHYLYGTPKVEE